MENIIHLFVLIPFTGFLVSLLIRKDREVLLSKTAFTTMGSNLLFSLGFTIWWIFNNSKPLNFHDWSLYDTHEYSFCIDFFFDKITAVYLLVGNLIAFMVVAYSRYYMHREEGYKRFFNTLLFFWLGYTLTILAGNFETLFIGWEILGISSFLLIAFYRQRYLPVKNALKVFTIYRIGDVGILLAMWGSHHLWHENVLFIRLHNYELVHEQLLTHSGTGVFISLMILVAALAKSAQLPFSAWLPRAMEGPTPSSAIFYGSLSVHIGAFLLLRTFPFWEHQIVVRWLIAFLGLGSAVITTMIARVQPTVKGQIAYSSAAQIGIIFMEIAAGLEILALIHFAGNAFLRTYQLLISPSVVAYLIREQFYNYQPVLPAKKNVSIKRIQTAFYLLSLKEWHLDTLIFRMVFKPLKRIRVLLGFLTVGNVLFLLLPLYLCGLYVACIELPELNEYRNYAAVLAALLALLMAAKAYNERSSSRLAWILAVFAHFFIDLAVTFNDHLNVKEASIYLGGIVVSGILGYYCLYRVKTFEQQRIGLNRFHGLVGRYRVTAFLFLLACLGVAGFPITTTFLGEDLILAHIHENQAVLALLISLTFIINGIAVIRIYTRVFLGHSKRDYQHTTELTI